MKIAIAKTIYTDEINSWTNYCKVHNIDFIIIDPYDSNVVEQVADCDVFMWHHSQTNYKDLLFANQLLFAMQQAGKTVYPDFYSNWHFDDKLGQKYLLEAIGAPLVKSYVFYDKEEALDWAAKTTFPKVFKLRSGAASTNVKLVHTYGECKKFINKSFGNGFPYFDALNHLKDCFEKRLGFKSYLSALSKIVVSPKGTKFIRKEIGYAYFQDFMPNNSYDTRVVVIGSKYACAERRFNRNGDFRASGSGSFSYEGIDEKIVAVAFDAAKKLRMQTVAFDFVYDEERNPRIVEICYGFGTKGISHSPGYYTDDLVWHECKRVPISEWVIDSVLAF